MVFCISQGETPSTTQTISANVLQTIFPPTYPYILYTLHLKCLFVGLQNIIKKYQGVSVHYCQSQYLKIVKKVKPRSLSWQCNWWYREHTQKYRPKNAPENLAKSAAEISVLKLTFRTIVFMLKKGVLLCTALLSAEGDSSKHVINFRGKKTIFSRAVMLASIEPWIVWICNALRQEDNQLQWWNWVEFGYLRGRVEVNENHLFVSNQAGLSRNNEIHLKAWMSAWESFCSLWAI